MKVKSIGWVLFLGAVCLSGAARAAEAPAAAPSEPAAAPAVEVEAPDDSAPVVELDGLDVDAACEGEIASSEDVAPEGDVARSANEAAACKPCKDRTWCKCSYNGTPRSSCNPCCYTNNIGVTTCLD